MRAYTLLIVILVCVLAGCGGSGPSALSGAQNATDTTASISAEGSGTVITGRVIDMDDQSPVVGASVKLGSTEGVSGVDGSFSIALPSGSTVASACAGGPSAFSVTIPEETNGQAISASYGGAVHSSQEIPVPAAVLAGSVSDLGVVALVMPEPDGGLDAPPPPPVFGD